MRWYAPDSHHLDRVFFSLSTLLLPAGTAGLVERGYAAYSSAQSALVMAISWVSNGREAAVHGSLFMRIMFWPAGPIPPPVPIVWALAQFMVVAPSVSVQPYDRVVFRVFQCIV